MTPRRDPGPQIPLLIKPDESTPDVNVEEMRALLESMVEGLKQYDGTTRQAASGGDDQEQDVRALMTKSEEAFSELGIRVEYRTQTQ